MMHVAALALIPQAPRFAGAWMVAWEEDEPLAVAIDGIEFGDTEAAAEIACMNAARDYFSEVEIELPGPADLSTAEERAAAYGRIAANGYCLAIKVVEVPRS